MIWYSSCVIVRGFLCAPGWQYHLVTILWTVSPNGECHRLFCRAAKVPNSVPNGKSHGPFSSDYSQGGGVGKHPTPSDFNPGHFKTVVHIQALGSDTLTCIPCVTSYSCVCTSTGVTALSWDPSWLPPRFISRAPPPSESKL